MSAAIAIFAKAPVPGQVKTRLVPPLTPEEAATVARACLETTLRRFVPAVDAVFTVFLDGDADPALRALAQELRVPIFPQVGADLGARLATAFRSLREGGASKILALGSDSPTLDPAWIASAVAALDAHDVVIGPTEDGGYYLIGVRGTVEGIFEKIPWSTDGVARATLERAAALRLRVRQLPVWYDVDDVASLRRAMRDLGLTAPAFRGLKLPEEALRPSGAVP